MASCRLVVNFLADYVSELSAQKNTVSDEASPTAVLVNGHVRFNSTQRLFPTTLSGFSVDSLDGS